MNSRERISERAQAGLASRATKGWVRRLVSRPASHGWLDLASNDYLQLSKDPAVLAAAVAATDKWGASAAASPLITGYTELHADLEQALASWHGYPHGLIWNSGYTANSAALSVLPKKGDAVLADRLIHASLITGILRSGARLRRFPHNDLTALRSMLIEESQRDRAVFVVTESVFSMDGDGPDLQLLSRMRDEFEFFWVLDEAHAVGWFGETGAGALEAQRCPGKPDLLVGTLGKALGSQGAYTLFRDGALREWLLNEAGEFVYSTYLAPAAAGAALAAVQRARALAPERPALHRLSLMWRAAIKGIGLAVPDGESPIIPVPLGSVERTMAVQRALLQHGFRVSSIRPPTVPEGGARLRISLHRGLTDAHRDAFITALREALRCA
jgi:8-amino-7-oxononanoate synthase